MSKGSAFDLGAFLAEQAREGKVDSEGGFTVSQDKAREKLARFSMPFDYAWVLKVTQAAVAWRSPEIRVRTYRTFTSIEFRPEMYADIPDEDKLVGRLLSGKVGGDDPLDMFCLGLRSLVEQSGLSFVLTSDPDPNAARAIQSGPDAEALYYESLSYRLPLFAGIRLLIGTLPFSQFFLCRCVPKRWHSERPDLNIVRALEQFCFLSPVPILVDGRRIDRLFSNPTWGFTRHRRPLLLTGWSGGAYPRLRVPEGFEQKLISIRAYPQRAEREYHGRRDFASWLYARTFVVPSSPSQKLDRRPTDYHTVFLVRHGVIVERRRISLPTRALELCLFLNAEGLETDLTGLALQVVESSTPDLRDALARALEKLVEVAHDPETFLRTDIDEQSHLDTVSGSLTRDSEEKVRAGLAMAPEHVVKTLSTLVALGRRSLTFRLDPPPIAQDQAEEWLESFRHDLETVRRLDQVLTLPRMECELSRPASGD